MISQFYRNQLRLHTKSQLIQPVLINPSNRNNVFIRLNSMGSQSGKYHLKKQRKGCGNLSLKEHLCSLLHKTQLSIRKKLLDWRKRLQLWIQPPSPNCKKMILIGLNLKLKKQLMSKQWVNLCWRGKNLNILQIYLLLITKIKIMFRMKKLWFQLQNRIVFGVIS